MSEMVERVARAIATANGVHEKADIKAVPQLYVKWERSARAAIEAMREPTKAMLLRGVTPRGAQYEEAAEVCWQAMIDAALKE